MPQLQSRPAKWLDEHTTLGNRFFGGSAAYQLAQLEKLTLRELSEVQAYTSYTTVAKAAAKMRRQKGN